MRVLHIETGSILSKKIQEIVSQNGFSYVKKHFCRELSESLDKILAADKYDLVILDQCMPSLSIEHLIDKINEEGIVRPSIIVISSRQDFAAERHYFQLGIMAHFDRNKFDCDRFGKYLQTIKYEIEKADFFKAFQIAVIDDSKFSLNIIERIFSESGIVNVDYYQDSSDFLECKKKYDMFLIDWVMPVYDGEALTGRIRKANRDAIIILITAYNNGQLIPHCLSVGADDFIIKPLDYNLFMLRIYSCISRCWEKKELLTKNDELLEMAVTDNLTGIYNRTYFEKIYKDKLYAAKKYKRVFSLIMVDIDDFKNVNDEYGHLEGDRVLEEFVILLRQDLGSRDVLCRWGGEEFIALLMTNDINEAVGIAEKMRGAVKKHDFKNAGAITASFGVAKWRSGDIGEKLLRRLDNSLYLAKLTGKNKIVCEEKLRIVENGEPIKIEWDPFFTSGNAVIDEDHYNLIKISNEIIRNCIKADNQKTVYKLLEEMLKNIVLHFKREEMIMQHFKYAYYEEHKKNHYTLMMKILSLYDDYLVRKQDTVAIVEFLIQKVIVGHIIKRDFCFYDIIKK